jgi:hypothetical protein
MENKLTFTFALVVALFYIPTLLFMFKVMRQKQGRRYFFKAVKSILDRVLWSRIPGVLYDARTHADNFAGRWR